MKHLSQIFTLIEVVIAIAILALGLVAALSLSSSSSRRNEKSFNAWRSQHMLAQAAEYFLLEGADKHIPTEIFPYTGASASCFLTDAEEESNTEKLQEDWSLKAFNINISENGKIISEILVNKIIKEER